MRSKCAIGNSPVKALVVAVTFLSATALPQSIRVDSTPGHAANTFIPTTALGAGIDRISTAATDKLFTEPVMKQVLSAGWQTVSYRQNTELYVEAWHWNPQGSWSDFAGKGYFTGSATPAEPIRHSFGYLLPHRGFTRNDGVDNGYSRITDGDLNTYWKSNPYLTKAFTGEDDSLHPQWIAIKLAERQIVTAIRMAWAEPYARSYRVQYWLGSGDAIDEPSGGVWKDFPAGTVTDGKGGRVTVPLSPAPVAA